MTPVETLWTNASDGLRAFFRRRVRSREDADDLLHDTFARLHRSLPQMRDRDRLTPWLYRVARNALRDHYRRRRGTVTLPSDLAGRTESAEDLNAVVARWLREFAATLPDAYREAIEETELGHTTQRGLAARLGISVSAVKSRVQRGRKLLLKKLLDCCHVELDRRGNVVGYARREECACATP